jgi:hypothetical protein
VPLSAWARTLKLNFDGNRGDLLRGSGLTWNYVNNNTVVLKHADANKESAQTPQDQSTLNRGLRNFQPR